MAADSSDAIWGAFFSAQFPTNELKKMLSFSFLLVVRLVSLFARNIREHEAKQKTERAAKLEHLSWKFFSSSRTPTEGREIVDRRADDDGNCTLLSLPKHRRLR